MNDKNNSYSKPRRRFNNSKSPHNKPTNQSHEPLKVCTLSGTNEVGRNCNFLELDDKIIIIDCGFGFPEQELYGIDYLIPNFHYLKKNKDKILGILITHGHLDHTGALPYVLPELDFPPIYGGAFANELIKSRLKEFKMEQKVKLNNIHRETTMRLGDFKINFVGVTHSIPNAFAIFVETPKGNVFFSGDYKIDPMPANEPETDYEKLRQLRGKVDLAFMESTNASVTGRATSEGEVAKTLSSLIQSAHGRVVIASFSSQISRLYLTMQAAYQNKRKVFLSGRSLRNAYKIAKELHYIDLPENLVVSEKNLANYPDKEVLFLCTGSQGERYGALNRIANSEHNYFKVKGGDTVILSSSEIPGNEYKISSMTDKLIRLGADIITSKLDNVHASGHGMTIDMHMMYELIQPKAVVPIHGTLSMRYFNRLNLISWGMRPDDVHLTEDGQYWHVSNSTVKRGKQIASKPILIDGLGVGDIGEVVLRDRQQLAEYGMVIIFIDLSSRKKHIIGKIHFVSRGFVYVKTSQKLFDELENLIKSIHAEWINEGSNQNKLETKALKERINKQAANLLYNNTHREPMVMTVVF